MSVSEESVSLNSSPISEMVDAIGGFVIGTGIELINFSEVGLECGESGVVLLV